MSNIFYALILGIPALIIFPLTRLMKVFAASNDAEPRGYYSLIEQSA